MNWLMKLLDKDGTNQAVIDDNNALKVTGPVDPNEAGFIAIAGRVEHVVPATPRVNRVYVSEGNALKIAPPNLLWDDTFNATAQNTAKYKFAATTQTGAQAGGFLILNNSAITTINTNSGIQSWRTFPLFAKSETRVNISAMLTQVPQVNNLIEFGLIACDLTTRVAPTDGVFFRYKATGVLRGVISYGGVETETADITAPSPSVNHDYTIVIQTNNVVFYIDDVVQATITLLTDASGLGQPMSSASAPLCFRTYIGGSAPSLATQFKVSDVFVTLLGPDTCKPWSEQKAGMGHMGYQGQNGGTMGTTALYANSSNPGAAVPTNTTAALGSGLGGKFQETVSLAAGTDGIIQSYQNPAGSATQTPRNLIIRGVTISGVVTVVLAATALTATMSLAFGHTAVSLATAESASFASGTTKAPRRIALGCVGLASAAAVGTAIPPQTFKFDAPIVVAPGEFLAVVKNAISAAPATGVIMWNIQFDCYWE